MMPAPRRFNFTKTSLENLAPPTQGKTYYMDSAVRDLGCAIMPTGAITFHAQKRIDGRPRRIHLGRWPALSLKEARRRASAVTLEVRAGNDPTAERRASKSCPTLLQFWTDHYWPHHVEARLRTSTQTGYRSLWSRHLAPAFGSRKLSDIKRADVAGLHASIGAAGAKRAANLAIVLLRAMLSHAIDLDLLRGHNPCDRVRRFPEHPRERYLNADELARLWLTVEEDAAETGSWDVHDLVKLAVLTGARKGNLLSMKWSDVNLAARTWTIASHEAKAGRAIVVALAPGAVAILARRQAEAEADAVHVFPSDRTKRVGDDRGERGHLVDVTFWPRIREAAGITDVRWHDLRHVCASLMINSGAGLEVVASQLGHRDLSTARRYAHLTDATVQTAITRATRGLG